MKESVNMEAVFNDMLEKISFSLTYCCCRAVSLGNISYAGYLDVTKSVSCPSLSITLNRESRQRNLNSCLVVLTILVYCRKSSYYVIVFINTDAAAFVWIAMTHTNSLRYLTVYGYAFLFNSTAVVRASESMTASS